MDSAVPGASEFAENLRWPVSGMSLSDGPDEVIAINHFGPLPVTTGGNKHTLLVTDYFNHRAAFYVFTIAQFIAVGTTDILVNDFIPKWGCPKLLLSENGRQCLSRLLCAVCKLLGARKPTIWRTSVHPTMGNGGTESVEHTMAQLLSMVVTESQKDPGTYQELGKGL